MQGFARTWCGMKTVMSGETDFRCPVEGGAFQDQVSVNR